MCKTLLDVRYIEVNKSWAFKINKREVRPSKVLVCISVRTPVSGNVQKDASVHTNQ